MIITLRIRPNITCNNNKNDVKHILIYEVNFKMGSSVLHSLLILFNIYINKIFFI